MAVSHARRKRVMHLLREGLISVPEAAMLALVSPQAVWKWCRHHGVDPGERRKLWLAKQIAVAAERERKMANRNWDRAKRRKPTEDAAFQPGIMAPLLRDKRRAPPVESKAELQAIAAKATVEVKRVAPAHTFRCLNCREYNRRLPELKCALCGSTNVQRA